jgi:hypothetical protein
MVDERRRAGRPNGAARDEAYTAIRRCVKSRIAEFYQGHPEWVDDERSQRGVESLVTMLRCILMELDNYHISKEPPQPTPEPVAMGCGLGVFVCQIWEVVKILSKRRP